MRVLIFGASTNPDRYAYKALETLSKHPSINNDKISITGWSLGGAFTLFSAWLPLKRAINKDLNFAWHLDMVTKILKPFILSETKYKKFKVPDTFDCISKNFWF